MLSFRDGQRLAGAGGHARRAPPPFAYAWGNDDYGSESVNLINMAAKVYEKDLPFPVLPENTSRPIGILLTSKREYSPVMLLVDV